MTIRSVCDLAGRPDEDLRQRTLSVRFLRQEGNAACRQCQERCELVRFFFGGELSELPARHVIPQELALDVLVDSVENEQRSSLIE